MVGRGSLVVKAGNARAGTRRKLFLICANNQKLFMILNESKKYQYLIVF